MGIGVGMINIIVNKIKKVACGAIFISADTNRVLLNLRAPYKSHALTWCLWGGMVEEGESPKDCLMREIYEEIGFVPEIEKINPFDVFESQDKHFRYYSFVCVVDSEFIPRINNEAVGYCWTKLGIWPSPMHQGAVETLCSDHSISKLNLILANYNESHGQHN